MMHYERGKSGHYHLYGSAADKPQRCAGFWYDKSGEILERLLQV